MGRNGLIDDNAKLTTQTDRDLRTKIKLAKAHRHTWGTLTSITQAAKLPRMRGMRQTHTFSIAKMMHALEVLMLLLATRALLRDAPINLHLLYHGLLAAHVTFQRLTVSQLLG